MCLMSMTGLGANAGLVKARVEVYAVRGEVRVGARHREVAVLYIWRLARALPVALIALWTGRFWGAWAGRSFRLGTFSEAGALVRAEPCSARHPLHPTVAHRSQHQLHQLHRTCCRREPRRYYSRRVVQLDQDACTSSQTRCHDVKPSEASTSVSASAVIRWECQILKRPKHLSQSSTQYDVDSRVKLLLTKQPYDMLVS